MRYGRKRMRAWRPCARPTLERVTRGAGLRPRFVRRSVDGTYGMNTLVAMLLWLLLLCVCWPLALLALVAWPLLWLLSIPFRLFGAAVHGLLALVSSLFLLPARLLGYR
jgi:hypothetical protein